MSAVVLKTGWGFSGRFPVSWDGPVGNRVACVNGWNDNLLYDVDKSLLFELGLDPPTVAPTLTTSIPIATSSAAPTLAPDAPAGSEVGLTGAFFYRVRLIDKTTGLVSVESVASSFLSPSAQTVVVTLPSAPAGSTGQYWIIERTYAGAANTTLYFPVNGPAYTIVGTATYRDALPDTSLVAPVSESGLIGTYAYRVRRRDPVLGTLSLPSPIATITIDGTLKRVVNVTMPAEPAQRTGCYWIVERTVNGGSTFYPLNLGTDGKGTAPAAGGAATVYLDSIPDNDSFVFFTTLGEFQSRPRAMKLARVADNRLFLGGGLTIRGTANMTQGAKLVSLIGDNFFSPRMATEGWLFSASEAAGQRYLVGSILADNQLNLTEPYTGATGTKSIYVQSQNANRVGFSELNAPEYFGLADLTGPDNEEQIGDAAPVTALAFGGKYAGLSHLVIAKFNKLYDWQYQESPHRDDGAKIIEINAQRGALGRNCMLALDGRVFGIDTKGCWLMIAGGYPQEIGGEVAYDWKNHSLDFTKAEQFWIQYEPETQSVIFWCVEAGQTAATVGFVFALSESFVGSRKFAQGYEFTTNGGGVVGTRRYGKAHTAGFIMADSEGRQRAVSYADMVDVTGLIHGYA